jgi:hypothetical protein
MKDKLLELISLELKDLPNLNFYDTGTWYSTGNPARTEKRVIRRENEKAEVEDWNKLQFTLKFPDGKPDVIVFSNLCSLKHWSEPVKTPWWKRQSERTIDTYTYNLTYHVSCGELKYTLTDAEATQLYEETSSAFNAMMAYRIKAKEIETIDKINARIAKHKTKKDDKIT